MALDVEAIARAMLDAAEAQGQHVRRIHDGAEAAAVRARVRALARERGLRIRTARMDDAVAVVRLDAPVWHEDAATMRRLLQPSD